MKNLRAVANWARGRENSPWGKGADVALRPIHMMFTTLPTIPCHFCGRMKIAGAKCNSCQRGW